MGKLTDKQQRVFDELGEWERPPSTREFVDRYETRKHRSERTTYDEAYATLRDLQGLGFVTRVGDEPVRWQRVGDEPQEAA